MLVLLGMIEFCLLGDFSNILSILIVVICLLRFMILSDLVWEDYMFLGMYPFSSRMSN